MVAAKFVIQRVIGEGGLGVVLAAKHLALDQMVAIKCLRPTAMEKSWIVERFLREARLAAKIRSDHVVRVFDVGRTPEGVPFMVMELLEGIDLRRRVTEGVLPLPEAVDYVLQACEALAEAHVAGIIHRDLKPENLFLTKRPNRSPLVKVLDFGISKYIPSSEDPNMIRTQPAQFFGTPVYMSPEQLRSATEVDARTDIWALGVAFFELLTGQLPFTADSLPALCSAISGARHFSARQFRPDLPPEVELVIDKCLAKDPRERFHNVAELAAELSMFGCAESVPRTQQVIAVIREAGQDIHPPRLLTPVSQPPLSDGSPGRLQERTPSGASSPTPENVQPPKSSRPLAAIAALCVTGVVIASGAFLTRAAFRKSASTHLNAAPPFSATDAETPPSSAQLATPPPPVAPIDPSSSSALPIATPPVATTVSVPVLPRPEKPATPSYRPTTPASARSGAAESDPAAPSTAPSSTASAPPVAGSVNPPPPGTGTGPSRRKFRTEY